VLFQVRVQSPGPVNYALYVRAIHVLKWQARMPARDSHHESSVSQHVERAGSWEPHHTEPQQRPLITHLLRATSTTSAAVSTPSTHVLRFEMMLLVTPA
jgi:hypothetical protein